MNNCYPEDRDMAYRICVCIDIETTGPAKVIAEEENP